MQRQLNIIMRDPKVKGKTSEVAKLRRKLGSMGLIFLANTLELWLIPMSPSALPLFVICNFIVGVVLLIEFKL